ncbi:stage VI sporulation protein F [Paenibacillus sp. GCM10012307]|uniref:Stage VI sporulation protein F n=1 Tax=Paenibacillus roseus TaxID=2798579 RepID=A0A934J7R1_9BACL|nr:stage VI sporulation protein F [Paenibacillus roseus]
MSYKNFGIRPELVERVKAKMKHTPTKERIKLLISGVSKHDLQDRSKVRRLVKSAASILKEPLTDTQEEQLTAFVLAQKIDPKNTFHLIKLWGMFR